MSSVAERRNAGTKRHWESAGRKSLWRNSGLKTGVGVGDFGQLGSALRFRDKDQLRS